MEIRSPKKILVMNPPTGLYRRDDRCQSRVEDQTIEVVFAPIDLASYAAVLRRAGATVVLRDYPGMGLGWDDYRSDLRSFDPDAIAIKTTLATLEDDLEACRLARESRPDTVTIGIGESLAIDRERTLANHAELDFVIVGEPEPTLEEMVEARDLTAIPGLSFRNGEYGNVITTAERPPVGELDSLPWPARDLLNNARYLSPETGRPLTVIHAHRGCPSKCIFCPAGALSGYRVRFRSAQSVFGEIEQCARRFGIRDFLFHGDTFTIKRSWVVDLCRLIVDAGLDVRWGCNSRVDTIDDERAEWMKRAGCWVVAFGIESGSQEMLDKMKKGAEVEQARRAVEVCRRHGLRTHAFYVIGLPWESASTLEETYRLARELDTDFFDFNIAYPLPGTEFFEIAHRENLFETDAPSQAGYAQAAVRTFYLSAGELEQWRRRSLLRLYFRPRYVVRTLIRSGSPRRAWRYFRAAIRRLRNVLRPKKA